LAMAVQLKNLLRAAKVLSPAVEVKLRAIPDRDDAWVCFICVGSVTLIESSVGTLDEVLIDAGRRVKNMGTSMRSHIDEGELGGNGDGST